MSAILSRLIPAVVLCVLLGLAALPAQARLPDAYRAIAVTAPPGEGVRSFDLRPAIAQAQAAGKPILLYFGAHDCPFCKVLERSWDEHAARLSPKIAAKYTLIAVEGWLRGAKMAFVLPDGEYPMAEFRDRIGDPHRRFLWPQFFILDPRTLKSTRSLPQGNNDYLYPDVAELTLDL